MTDFEQIREVFTQTGVPHTVTMFERPTAQPAQEITVAHALSLWFNSRGDFLQVYEETYDDAYQTPRTDGKRLEEDESVLENARRAEEAYTHEKREQQQQDARAAYARAKERIAYRKAHPLPPGEAPFAIMNQWGKRLMEQGRAATLEQAIDLIAQEDPELADMVLSVERKMAREDQKIRGIYDRR